MQKYFKVSCCISKHQLKDTEVKHDHHIFNQLKANLATVEALYLS